MGLSIVQRLARLPKVERDAYLDTLDEKTLAEMLAGEWWSTARPEQIPPPGNWLVCLFMAGRGAGKAVALDTLVPTPSGMTVMGEIKTGDMVLDETGWPCRVTATWDRTPDKAYRLTFSDGVTVDACDEHEWVTWDHAARKSYGRTGKKGVPTFHDDFPRNWVGWDKAKHLTTQGIADTLTFGKRGDLNHCVPLTRPLMLPRADLPVEPWTLGFWLGNGHRGSGEVSAHQDDLEHVASRLRVAGYPCKVNGINSRLSTTGLMVQLRDLGVLIDKHVPHAYLWASETQRRELLAGLMDSDGHAGDSLEFCSTDEPLARAVLHLARSLGERPVLSKGRATLYGVDHGPKYRVCWRGNENPFRSPRKRSMFKSLATQKLRNRHRMIVSVEPIAPVPMRCLEVDSPNHMYLVTDGLVPTHNSRSSSEWLVDRILKHPFDRTGNPTEWLLIAETLSDARAINVDGPSGLLNVLRRRRIPHRYKQTPRPMILFPDGVKVYLEGADDPDVGRGYNAAGAVLDEIAKWKYSYESWYEGILPSLRMDLVDDHPRAFVTTTPKPIKILQEWMRTDDGTVHMITGSTFDNAANLSKHVLAALKKRYDGTTMGAQELYGQMLDLASGGLFKRMDIINHRVYEAPDDIVTTVVGADPNLTGDEAMTGIVVACRTRDNDMYILADRSVNDSGRSAALAMWRAVAEFGAQMLVYEENLGKRYLKEVLTDAYTDCVNQGMFPQGTTPPMKPIHAKHGKATRAEPVAMRAEQGRLHMVGTHEDLEDQCVLYDPKSTRESPDRMDAMVHACLELMAGEKRQMRMGDPTRYDLDRIDRFMTNLGAM